MTETGNAQRAGSHLGWPEAGGGTGNVADSPVSGVVIQAGTVSGGMHMAGGTRFAVPLPHHLPAGRPGWSTAPPS